MKPTMLLRTMMLAVLASGCSTPDSGASNTSARRPYPLKTCLVSRNALDSMGDTITEVYQNQEVKFCCEPCVKKFHANPAKYLQKIQ